MLLILVDGEWILSIAFWNSVVGILPKPEQVHKLGLLQASSETSIPTRATVLLEETSTSSVTTPQ